jgi:hypothetical protein
LPKNLTSRHGRVTLSHTYFFARLGVAMLSRFKAVLLMFRFTLRELLALTLVVAMGLGWWLRDSTLLAEAEQWRGAAGALEYALRKDGCEVEWDFASSIVNVSWPPARRGDGPVYLGRRSAIRLDSVRPSAEMR